MVRLLALVLSALLALPAVGQLQTQPTGLKKMDGSDSGGGGGSGDVTSVAATANTPLSVSGSPCTSGACAFTFTLGTVTIAKGGTNITSYTLGDLLYSSATNTLAKLAGNTTTTKMFLMQAGDGVASAAPAWTATAADFPTLNQNTSGLAGTATALAADPADCSAGQYASSINASGTLGCAQVAYSQVSSTPVIGTNTQAWDADLDLLAALSPTTKGDLLAYNGSAWGRVPAGTNDHVLTADSAQTLGVKWAAAAGGLSGLTTGAALYADTASSLAATPLYRVDANTLAQANSTTAQTHRVFKTNDGSAGAVGTNYAYLDMKSDANGGVFEWAKGGTGAGTFISFKVPASSYPAVWYVNGAQVGYVNPSGALNMTGAGAFGSHVTGCASCSLGQSGTQWQDGWFSRDVYANHLMGVGTAPTVGGSCGTSPTIAGKDSFHKITVGTGSPTSCTVTFGRAYSTAPVCVANAATTTTALLMATTTTTAVVSSAALTAGEVLHVMCGGF